MISPKEIDETILLWPSVVLAAAVGVPHPLYGEEVVAFLTSSELIDEIALSAFCWQRLSPWKVPKRFYRLDDLPKGPSGKVQRLKLVKVYEELAARGQGLESQPPVSGLCVSDQNSHGLTASLGADAVGPPTAAKRKLEVVVDFETCKGCGYCLELCPNDVFEPGQGHNAKGYRPPSPKRVDRCVGCQVCFLACPDFCLEVKDWRPGVSPAQA
ncbi:MAG: 4Fe-4S binding protein [Deltaproteobacteria bacterium]|nr:4Fe-4S binding protein [Deltaproteobacteria bacterium]